MAKELSTAGLFGRGARTRAAVERGRSSITTSSARSSRASTPTVLTSSRIRSAPRREGQGHRNLALIYGRLVGGSNAHFTGNFWRLRPIDFNEASTLGGVPGTGLVDWPITYEELEPYYSKAEWELGVSGVPGPFDPPRSRPYPMPPLPVKSSGRALRQGRAGARLSSAAGAARDQLAVPYNGRPACQHCGFCLFFMCEFRAKSTSMATMLPLAEATGRCEIRPESYVARVETDRSGRATGVAYFDAREAASAAARERGGALRQRGRDAAAAPQLGVVALPAGPRQLQRRRRQVPDVQHVLRRPRAVRASAERIQERAEHAHAARLLRHGSEAGLLRRRRHRRAIREVSDHLRARRTARRTRRRGARASRAALAEQFTRSMFFGTHGTSLPLETNRITIERGLKDAWGLPCMRVTYRTIPDDLKSAEFLSARALEIAQAAGARKAWPEPVKPQTQSVHLLGTCRMGNDPRSSVIDRYHRDARRPESLHLRRQQHGHFVARPAD